jgi:hypothetical protein
MAVVWSALRQIYWSKITYAFEVPLINYVGSH